MFIPLTACPILETTTTTSNSIPSTSQAVKQTSKNRRKKRPIRSITSQIDIQMTPYKPKKSAPLQDTSGEDMLVSDVEKVESPEKKKVRYYLSEKYWQEEAWKRGQNSHTVTPNRVRNSLR
ncbi:hypothetical protein TNCV_1428891 [Trichonephila clavipes]|nr:hypothetical protein TNCV_1428891 [Trichonephila clavipes]